MKKYFLRGFLLALALGLFACVTETKNETEKTSQTPATAAPVIETGAVVVKCRLSYNKQPTKFFRCVETTVNATHEALKTAKSFTFKGEQMTIPVDINGSYTLEVKTKGCEGSRVMSGISTGMNFGTQFENCVRSGK